LVSAWSDLILLTINRHFLAFLRIPTVRRPHPQRETYPVRAALCISRSPVALVSAQLQCCNFSVVCWQSRSRMATRQLMELRQIRVAA